MKKESVTIFLFLFVLSFIVINWDSVSWLFSYRAMGSLSESFLNPYPNSKVLAQEEENISKSTGQNIQPIAIKQYPASAKENSIEIPKINVQAPIVFTQTTDLEQLTGDLDRGVVYYPGSVWPGQSGQTVILGHSAPPNWPRIKYDWVFSETQSLLPGDIIVVHFNQKQYTYTVRETEIVNIGQEIKPSISDKNTLTIVSCWPPGKNYQRIAVHADLR